MKEVEVKKYRIPSARLQSWDYSNCGYYFVTICTKNFIHYFGKIADSKIILSPAGLIVKEEWEKTAALRTNIELDEYIIMPNHFHGIAILDAIKSSNQENNIMNWKPGSLGAVINQFKGACTKRIKLIDKDFAWQSRYYDRIIRNDKELEAIRNYIHYNPLKWDEDEYNK